MTELGPQAMKHLEQLAAEPIAGRYELVDRIGEGGMGAVFLARDLALDRDVALKVLRSIDRSPGTSQLLEREAKVIASMEHPGISPIYDLGQLDDGRLFYVMKLIRGVTLGEYSQGASLSEKLRVFERVCESVAFAHQRDIVHRDLKPSNVMVGDFGDVIVIDWGLATQLAVSSDAANRDAATPVLEPGDVQTIDETATWRVASGVIAGTPGYMAPEQARGEGDAVNKLADVYSLGSILFFLLTDQNAIGMDDFRRICAGQDVPPPAPRKLLAEIPPALDAICVKAMSSDSADRYGSVAELRADVSSFLRSDKVLAYRESAFERCLRFAGKYSTLLWLILAYLLMRVFLIFASQS